MDFLLEHEEAIRREVCFATANLLNLEVDLVFFDTTSTCFELDEEDEDGVGERGDVHRAILGRDAAAINASGRSATLDGRPCPKRSPGSSVGRARD